MSIRAALLLLACLYWAGSAAASESAEARAARYYAQGLERPLLQLRTGALLSQACNDRLRRACDDEQRKLAAGNQILALLDALTLFPQRPEADPLAAISKPKELRQKLSDTSAALMREAGTYDLALFARYGATLYACPPEEGMDAFHASLISLRLIDLVGFQGLGVADVQAAQDANFEAMGQEIEQWEQRPAEDCLAARKLGEYLMQLLAFKLQPWSNEHGATRQPDFDFNQPRKEEPLPSKDSALKRQLAQAVAGNFVSVVATELQLVVFPETAPRIKELADQAGFPSQD